MCLLGCVFYHYPTPSQFRISSDFFTSPLQWEHNANTQANLGFQYFKVSMCGLDNLSWFSEELQPLELQPNRKLKNVCSMQQQQQTSPMKKNGTDDKRRVEVRFGNQNGMPEAVTFVALLKSCTQQKDLQRGINLHNEIVQRGLLKRNVFVGSALIHMYSKCGALTKAQQVFDELPDQDVVSWNALIGGYTQHGYGDQALDCFAQMQAAGMSPDAVTAVCILKACGSIGDLDKGLEINAWIVREGLLERDVQLGTALVDMYAKCGAMEKAQGVFDGLPTHDVVSWNALMGGYVKQEDCKAALRCFEQMQGKGYVASSVTFACALKACGLLGALDRGQEIHCQIKDSNLLETNNQIGSALIDMYIKCGALGNAQEVFDKLLVRSIASWTALIGGYAQLGYGWKALELYEEMQMEGVFPNELTYSCMLKACGTERSPSHGQGVHAKIVQAGLLSDNDHLGTALLDMYANCGLLQKAAEVFDELPVCSTVAWNALITGYVQHGYGEEALECSDRMLREGFSWNVVTFSCILRACGSIRAGYKGQEMHSDLVKLGVVEMGVIVGTALVDMYAQCNMIVDAQHLFDELPVRNVISWSALMLGYAQLGDDVAVFSLFDDMMRAGIEPDLVTFTIVLSICSHKGLLDRGQMFYEMMSNGFGLTPALEHGSCMVDLFARAGDLNKAASVIEDMEPSANLAVWHTFLGACRKWGNVEFGRWAFEHATELDEKDGFSYVCMINIYCDVGRYEDAKKIEAMRLEKQARFLVQ